MKGDNKRIEENSVTDLESFSQNVPDEHLLLREMTHRIKNEFTSAINLMSLAAARSSNTEARSVLTDVIDQLYNYARVHRALEMPAYDTPIDASDYMRTLCHFISKSRLNRRGIELIFAESPVRLSSARCWSLGMITSELIANAERHAFGEGGGTIQVELASRGAFIECRVSDNGSALGRVRPGQGTKIVKAFVKRLDGEFVQRLDPRGTTSILVFPRQILHHSSRPTQNYVTES